LLIHTFPHLSIYDQAKKQKNKRLNVLTLLQIKRQRISSAESTIS